MKILIVNGIEIVVECHKTEQEFWCTTRSPKRPYIIPISDRKHTYFLFNGDYWYTPRMWAKCILSKRNKSVDEESIQNFLMPIMQHLTKELI